MSELKKKTDDIENLSIEEAFSRLNQVLEGMDNDEIKLEESFELYNQGLSLVKHCHNKLDEVEKKIIVLEAGNHEF
jgi:exodeoxyribonuclease VII small subunit